ncbi:MAG: excalibur calcium-binding domain-containing protein [Deltaproteobacteria bacterium]|nr:excalibur calcium-binding domain-containing protein [Deltaproteobacteria bacterium]
MRKQRFLLILLALVVLALVAACLNIDHSPSPSPSAPCNCAGPDLNCSDFATHAEAQRCYDYCKSQGYGDVFRLDADKDGIACESLP